MKKSITIQIPAPCHEDWNKMTATEKGKFCNVCTKEVFDFTKVTDEELVKRVYNKEKICGRFKASQLNREMKLERKSGFSLAPLAASFLLPFTLLASTKTETNTKSNKLQGNFTSLCIGSLHKNPSDRMQIITIGKITDENGKPIFNVEITSNESKQSELSGLKGDYRVVSLNDETLYFKKKGYITQEINVHRKSVTLNITLKKEVVQKSTNSNSFTIGKIAPTTSIKKTTDSISEIKPDAAKVVIKGTVTDENELPLPGVNIVVKGTTTGTQSDFDGIYQVEVEKNQVLVFSYVGFETEEITLSNINNTINLSMIEHDVYLGVILTGYVVVADDSNRLMGYNSSDYNDEPSEWRQKTQQSLDNEKEYSRIKRARKKVAKKLKRRKK